MCYCSKHIIKTMKYSDINNSAIYLSYTQGKTDNEKLFLFHHFSAMRGFEIRYSNQQKITIYKCSNLGLSHFVRQSVNPKK